MKTYGLYDTRYYEQCVYIGTIREIADYLKTNPRSLYCYISRKKNGIRDNLLYCKYELIEVPDEEIEEKTIKPDEIFKEVIKAFMPEKYKFEIYNGVKYIAKEMSYKEMEDEKWKEIDGFNYSISNYGRVKNNNTQNIKELRPGKFGYQINLWNKGKGKMFTISRLVANYYIREVKDNERVRHKDGDIRNNYYKNLEIVNKIQKSNFV